MMCAYGVYVDALHGVTVWLVYFSNSGALHSLDAQGIEDAMHRTRHDSMHVCVDGLVVLCSLAMFAHV